MRRSFLILGILGILLSAPLARAASSIDTTNAYAWGENIGWLNFGSSQGNVQVSDTALTGYAWGENVGWISLNCSDAGTCGTVNYSVARDGSGNLSGYAWGENVGWISLNCSNTSTCGTVSYGVSIDAASGDFSGYAWGENVGWISFNCSTTSSCGTVSYKVSLAASSGGSSAAAAVIGGVGIPVSKLYDHPPGTPAAESPKTAPPAGPPAHTAPRGAPAVKQPASKTPAYPALSKIEKTVVAELARIKIFFQEIEKLPLREIFKDVWNFFAHPVPPKEKQLPSVMHSFNYDPNSIIRGFPVFRIRR